MLRQKFLRLIFVDVHVVKFGMTDRRSPLLDRHDFEARLARCKCFAVG